MAKFYLTDVPTTPKASSRSRAANIPKEPYQVQGRPPTMPQIDAKVADINIEKNIPSLMQKELPREVSSGLVEGVQETGRAQARAGQASAAAAEAWGKAAQTMSESMSTVAAYLQKSKDIADESRVKNAWNMAEAQFQLEVDEGKLNATQALELWPKYQQRIDTEVGAMNLSRHVRDSAIPELQVKSLKQQAQLTHNRREEQAKSDSDAILTQRDYAAKNGDIEGATKATHDLYKGGHINEGQREKMLEEDKTAFDTWRAQTQVASDPRYALIELEQAAQTGKSDLYPHLPISSIHALRNQARGELEKKETETLNSVSSQVAQNKLKTPGQIDDAAGGNVAAHKLDSLKESLLKADPPYSQEAMIKTETAISTYVKEAPDTGSPEYHRILDEIHKTAPKAEWERLKGDLNKKRNEDKNALPGEDWFNQHVQDVKQLADDGWFAGRKYTGYGATMPAWLGGGGTEPALDLTLINKGDTDPKARQYRLEHRTEIDEMYGKARSIQIELQKWRKANPGNDHKTQLEAKKVYNELLGTSSAASGREPIRKAVTPPLPTSGVMGTPAPTTSSATPISNVRVTNYVPGMGGQEGGNEVKDRKGPAYTMEDFSEGKTPYVSVAVNKDSPLRGKFLVSDDPDFKGVRFKAEDIGSGVGPNQVDVAWRDPAKATTGTKEGVTFRVEGDQGVAGLNIKREIDPSYPAMQRPRDVAQISKIVVHGDVKTSVPDLIAYAKQVDRGYHYYIARDGSVTEVVPPDHIANHIKGGNSDSIGIVIAGADNGKQPTAAQDASAKQLISQLGRQYNVDPQDVKGHGERQPNRRDVREGGNVARDIRENGYI